MSQTDIAGYRWDSAELTCAHDYLLPAVMAEMASLKAALRGGGGRGVSLNWVVVTAVWPTCSQGKGGL